MHVLSIRYHQASLSRVWLHGLGEPLTGVCGVAFSGCALPSVGNGTVTLDAEERQRGRGIIMIVDVCVEIES